LIDLKSVHARAEGDAGTHGYHLNPDPDFLNDLLEGLRQNEERYGYPSCPCRLATGIFEVDRDIICPCDYRDPDVEEYGCCYCALYVRKDAYEGKVLIRPIPERRPPEKQARANEVAPKTPSIKITGTGAVKDETYKAGMKMWYCKQCGYVCLREDPPYVCPICRAKREMFAEITIGMRTAG